MTLAAARAAQAAWALRPVGARLAVIRRLRRRLAADAEGLAASAARPAMSAAEILLAEVLPLLAACRFLERQAETLLAPRRPPGGRPLWLLGTRLRVRRVPFGEVLILAPGNYPLLLPGVQALQALVAGNAVRLKPAPGGAAPMQRLARALHAAGLPDGLLSVLADSHEAGAQALAEGADKVVLTGSRETGRHVLAALAATATPAVLELSGNDALIVLPGAPLATVARAIGYGLGLNAGQTCIAPRRILAVGATAAPLLAELAALLPTLPPRAVPRDEALRLRAAAAGAQGAGARILGAATPLADGTMRPFVLHAPDADALLPPCFGPAASLLAVADADTAVALANADAHALGAAVFGPPRAARALAARLRAGCVTVNDLILATADPRLPFAAAGASGFGVTRGAEGLLEMTRPQAVISRGGAWALPYRGLPDGAGRWIGRLLRLLYG